MTSKRKVDDICRSFRQDFPQFVDRVAALGFTIQLERRRRKPGQARAFFLNGYKQLTGYTTRSDGTPFTHDDAVANIDSFLTRAEADREAMNGLSIEDRFERVMAKMQGMPTRYGMIGEVRLDGGDEAHCFYLADFSGAVRLHGIGDVARGEAKCEPWRGEDDQLARFLDALRRDFHRRQDANREAIQ